jgi:hypothetical protein
MQVRPMMAPENFTESKFHTVLNPYSLSLERYSR